MKFASSLKLKLIYVFRINDEAHKGCLKIGETTCSEVDITKLLPNSKELNQAAKKRINEYTQTAGIKYELLYTELAISEYNSEKSFSDKHVHQVLLRSGIKKKVFDKKNNANEWFITDLETAKKAIQAAKNGKQSLNSSDISINRNPIIFRPEQQAAIELTKARFKKGNRVLWNAKMRFGKTLSALQVVKDLKYSKTLILTHRPVVDEGWFEDFNKIFYDTANYHYGSKNKGDNFDTLERLSSKGDNYVYFASMQDMRGSELVGGNFDKNLKEFSTEWDLIIVDEAHEGTQTILGQNVLKELKKENTKIIELSGTAYNRIDEYKEEDIYTWDYIMEQRAKKEWDKLHFGDPNPYASLPAMHIYTYDLGNLLNEYNDEDLAFNFREFFKTNSDGNFIHEKDIEAFLNLLSKNDENNCYPFSNDEYRDNFRHTLWMLPGVKEAKALSALLQKHDVFQHFKIVNVAGNGDDDEENEKAFNLVTDAIGDKPENTSTITLSCGRLTTGVTIKPWTAVLMLSGSFSTSMSSYMQTIFRVQSPATINGKMKEDCYVFDFAPDRALKVIAEAAKISSKAGKTTDNDRTIMGEFLNFCPIISVDGSIMRPYDVHKMLEQLKKVYIERVVNNGFEDGYLYNDKLLKLNDVELEEFNNLKGVIGNTKAMPKSNDIDINNQGFTDEEYEQLEKVEKKKKKDLTEDEKKILDEKTKKQKQRQDAISILRGISIRMPLLIYGADLSDEEKEITIDNFSNLIDPNSWIEFMPKGVTKQTFNTFKKYYDPEIFIAASKRIREMAKAADKLSVEDRIYRITNIFDTFRNPDKETVLTPWRVVNMHMGDCLGGFKFFDDSNSNKLETPYFMDNGKVTSEVFNPESNVLEINSKSGLYPLYIAYNIYRSRLIEEQKKYSEELTFEQKQLLWDITVRDNVFVVCKTKMAKSITKRTLVGFRNAKVNTRYFDDLINQITNKQSNFIEKMKKGKSFWKANDNDNMKFNAIVGNPPYQVMDGGAGVSAKPIYNLFVDLSKKIDPKYISMIMPSRWFAGGKGLDSFRASMLADKRIVSMFDYVNAKDCFPTASIGGGINYFLWDRNYIGKCNFTVIQNNKKDSELRNLDEYPVFVRYNKAINIIDKVSKYNNITSLISSRNPFGLSSNTRGYEKSSMNCLKIISSDGVSYLQKTSIDKNNIYLNGYKILLSKVTAEHAGEPDKNGRFRIISRTELLSPQEACTDSYLIIGPFINKTESQHCFLYLYTKFLRFMLLQAVSSINLSSDKFRFVPLQDFTDKSDIDWSKPISDIDKQLYKKYNLTDEEIAFIESMIKPM